MTDTMILPSGAEINIDRPDFSICETSSDFLEIKYALSEKIIEIELQIDLYEAGQRQSIDPTWLPRAKASLRYAKLYRDEAQNRQGQRYQLEKALAHETTERGVLEVLRALLPKDDFDHMIMLGTLISKGRLTLAAKKDR